MECPKCDSEHVSFTDNKSNYDRWQCLECDHVWRMFYKKKVRN